MSEPDDQRLRACFREVHERVDPPAPPFASVIRRGLGDRRMRPGTALAAVVGIVLLAGALLQVMRGRTVRAPGADEAMRLASEFSGWEAPTDFLLRTPGIEWLQSPPRFGAEMDDLPGDPPGPMREEVLR